MKIGTKANAIDDIGKVDTNNMKIKVNDKQVYPQKRYAIVRVNYRCPIILEFLGYDKICESDNNCYTDKCPYHYGDTKEQLIRKVATVLRRNLKVDVCSYKYKGKMRKLETIRFKGKGRFDEIVIELEELAKKIVEFLGVEK